MTAASIVRGSRSRIGILGAGAMGTLFAYMLAAEHDVALLDVRGDIIDQIAEHGVAVDDEEPRSVVATREPARLFNANAIFVFVKAQNTLGAVRPFAGQLNPSTPVVSLQNGLGNEEAIKTAIGGSVPMVLGITSEGCQSVGYGRSRRIGIGTTVLGSAGASHATSLWVAGLLETAGLSASVVYDIRPHMWGKLIANAAINPIAALLDRKNASVASDRDAQELAREITAEGAAVARALKISLPFADPWAYVRGIIDATADSRNSLTTDLSARSRTEIDQINGAIVAAGKRAGVPTPYNDAILRLVRAKQALPPE